MHFLSFLFLSLKLRLSFYFSGVGIRPTDLIFLRLPLFRLLPFKIQAIILLIFHLLFLCLLYRSLFLLFMEELYRAVAPFLEGNGGLGGMDGGFNPPPAPDPAAYPEAAPSEEQPRDPIFRMVEKINQKCDREETEIVLKARNLLKKKVPVITPDDEQDIKRAINMALHDAWETQDLTKRLKEFRKIRRSLGTPNCSVWDVFIDCLNSLGNEKFQNCRD